MEIITTEATVKQAVRKALGRDKERSWSQGYKNQVAEDVLAIVLDSKATVPVVVDLNLATWPEVDGRKNPQ